LVGLDTGSNAIALTYRRDLPTANDPAVAMGLDWDRFDKRGNCQGVGTPDAWSPRRKLIADADAFRARLDSREFVPVAERRS
jgi:hypothetical protein